MPGGLGLSQAWEPPPSPGGRGFVTEGLRGESPARAPLVGPSGSRPGSGAGRGRGRSRGKAGQEGGALWSGSRSLSTAAQCWSRVRYPARRPQLLPRMVPAVLLIFLLSVEQAGERVWRGHTAGLGGGSPGHASWGTEAGADEGWPGGGWPQGSDGHRDLEAGPVWSPAERESPAPSFLVLTFPGLVVGKASVRQGMVVRREEPAWGGAPLPVIAISCVVSLGRAAGSPSPAGSYYLQRPLRKAGAVLRLGGEAGISRAAPPSALVGPHLQGAFCPRPP